MGTNDARRELIRKHKEAIGYVYANNENCSDEGVALDMIIYEYEFHAGIRKEEKPDSYRLPPGFSLDAFREGYESLG
jgi:hypothetical protein